MAEIHLGSYYETLSNGMNSPRSYVPTSYDGNSFPVFAWHVAGFSGFHVRKRSLLASEKG